MKNFFLASLAALAVFGAAPFLQARESWTACPSSPSEPPFSKKGTNDGEGLEWELTDQDVQAFLGLLGQGLGAALTGQGSFVMVADGDVLNVLAQIDPAASVLVPAVADRGPEEAKKLARALEKRQGICPFVLSLSRGQLSLAGLVEPIETVLARQGRAGTLAQLANRWKKFGTPLSAVAGAVESLPDDLFSREEKDAFLAEIESRMPLFV
ncbi:MULTISPECIES: hypothetical protein [Jonquetella]|uniref:hypothetical protein n=1 Tax=Jonquetella TaxID=428711 RepID=UPI0003AE468A|nr:MULTISPECIES: hypothetical protein [Jonquetella]ERL24094.1 hypothetical protein HMPREF1249_1127 [Jonquetella sp. BV3C21]